MSQKDQPKPDLTEYEEESLPLDDALRRLLKAKPISKEGSEKPKPSD